MGARVREESKKRDLKNLVAVLGLAILSALLLSFFFVYNYGPSGRYLGETALISPNVLSDLNYNDFNPKISSDDRFVFDRIDFDYFQNHQKKNLQLTFDQYRTLYNHIRQEESLSNPDSVVAQFNNPELATLTIKVRTESPSAWQAAEKIFQEVQFIPDQEFFRVSLHEQNQGVHWVYFRRPGIYQEIMDIVAE